MISSLQTHPYPIVGVLLRPDFTSLPFYSLAASSNGPSNEVIVKYHRLALTLLSLYGLAAIATAEKPRVWIYTDLSDPRDQRTGGHPQNDPDDIVTMAALMLEANRFDIEGIVVSSTNRKNMSNPMPFVRDVLLEAYEYEAPFMNEVYGGYPASLPFMRSTITQVANPKRFDPIKDYSDLENYGTVAKFLEAAQEGPIYCLSWGPLTEPAIAVKHCLDTGKMDTLANIVFISHWTMSFYAQGSPETPYRVANCRDDEKACLFIHDRAREYSEIRYIEVGSVGQNGIVDGSAGFERLSEFNNSRLGQIYVNAKRYGDKPDMSDGSTFWLLTEAFGVELDHYRHDGTLDQATEEAARDKFKANGHRIVQDLLDRSNAAAKADAAWPESFIADLFTYVYQFINGRYFIHAPYDFSYRFVNGEGKIVKQATHQAGKYQLDLDDLPEGLYAVFVESAGLKQKFEIEKVAENDQKGNTRKVSVYDK